MSLKDLAEAIEDREHEIDCNWCVWICEKGEDFVLVATFHNSKQGRTMVWAHNFIELSPCKDRMLILPEGVNPDWTKRLEGM